MTLFTSPQRIVIDVIMGWPIRIVISNAHGVLRKLSNVVVLQPLLSSLSRVTAVSLHRRLNISRWSAKFLTHITSFSLPMKFKRVLDGQGRCLQRNTGA